MEYVKELRKKVGHQPLILPGAVVVITNEKNEVLLQHRRDGGWGLPSGLMELGESMEETARREVREETGLHIGSLALLKIFSGQDYFFKVANGDELYSVTAVYHTNQFAGKLAADSDETTGLQFFDMEGLPEGLTEEYQNYLNAYSKS